MKATKSSVIIITACICLLVGTYCVIKFAPKKNMFPGGGMGPGGFGMQEAETVTVRTASAEKSVLHDYVDTNGEIECESSIDCYPDIGGKVARVFVSLGDRVRKGDVLAEVDPSEPGAQYVNSSVYAPISGTITSTPKEVGTTVSTSTSITTIGDVSHLQIRSKVPERYVSYLKPGLKADIILEAYPKEVFSATVRKVSPVVDATSRTKEIILVFDRIDSRVNAGMFAKLTLFTVDYSGSVVVPSNAIVEKNGKSYVFVVSEDGNTAVQREVERGNSVDLLTQVVSGVEEGERIIVEGITSLSDGTPVRDITAGAGQNQI